MFIFLKLFLKTTLLTVENMTLGLEYFVGRYYLMNYSNVVKQELNGYKEGPPGTKLYLFSLIFQPQCYLRAVGSRLAI